VEIWRGAPVKNYGPRGSWGGGGEGANEEFLAHTTVLERETSLNMRDCFS